MLSKLHTFKLKLLSTSKEVGLRRLRSYAASLGGAAEIYISKQELIASFDEDKLPSVLMIDGSIQVSKDEISAYGKKSRIFLIQQDCQRSDKSPSSDNPCWSVEAYIQSTLSAYMASPICRINATLLCTENKQLVITDLLRWGHARMIWQPSAKHSISSVGLSFIRNFVLTTDWRRATEMFCHMTECNLEQMGLSLEQIDFASDGLMLVNVVRCKLLQNSVDVIRNITEELRIFNYAISAINRLPNNEIEIAVYHCPVHAQTEHDGPVVLVYNQILGAIDASKDGENTVDTTETKKLEEAG